MSTERVRGSLPSIIHNDGGLYESDLVGYFRTIFFTAQNLDRPYHNFRHMFHVTWLCYQACLFYCSELTKRQRRNLLIAAMFHDFDHSGMMGNDDLNIARAIRGLEKHLTDEDRPHFDDISSLIRATEYPYKISSDQLELRAQIIRDADLSQGLSVAWIQQVVFGLAAEWGKKPLEVLKSQIPFCGNLKFHTEWGQQMFPQKSIEGKIREVRELLDLLEVPEAVTV